MLSSSLSEPFDPEISVNSGQTFLWEKAVGSWYGIHGEHVVKFTIKNKKVEFSSFPEIQSWERKIFRMDDDVRNILTVISARDKLISKLVRKYQGLRLMRQDPHQCIISFVCASNTNIPMIRRMLYNLSKKFGSRVRIDGREFFTFPTADRIHRTTIDELRTCGLGYRAKAIKAVASSIATGNLDLNFLINSSYKEAKQELLNVYGIGNKIADCVLLFSLEKLDAFPIDVWIARALAGHYSWLQDKEYGEKLTPHQYDQLSETMRRHFGKYSGYAQQFLYYHMRENAGKKW